MALIPADTIEAIRSRVDIGELVAEYVTPLQRAGRNLKGRCPFHQERTPSFIVSPERQTFHCFGCGVGGDAFSFLMKLENLSFMEAAEKLAGKAGIKIEPADDNFGPEQKERLRLKEALAFAAEFYHELLLRAPGAEAARKYFASRKVSQESLEKFKLGFAPRTGSLIKAAQEAGYEKGTLIKAGLAAEREGRLREYFFDRVLFPIRDAKGAVVGLGGRTMGDGVPKYLNSPETPLFSKGRVLYGLFEGLAAVRKARKAVLMEGYMDVIAAHQHGLVQACAPLGTALTQEHAALLKRTCTEVAIVFDADSAGLNAAVRGAEVGLAAGLGVRIATVPSGKDPDEFLHAKGLEAFKKDCLAKATDIAEFKTELLLSKESQPLSPQAKSSVAKSVLATIEQCPDEILKAEWTKRLGSRLGVPVEALNKQMDKIPVPHSRRTHEAPAKLELDPSDRQVLCLLLKAPALAAQASENDFLSEPGRRLWKGIAGLAPWSEGWSARLLDAFAEQDRSLASELLVLVEELESADPEGILKGILGRKRGMARFKELEAMLHAGSLVDAGLKAEFNTLLSQLKGTRR
ncbi:MAG: DNA primase [Elusimicrobia bacterium]|nr:DNA primase [Elusimicrobiota bacterium]